MHSNNSTSQQAAIVLLSGGLDSTVALADVLSRMPVACVLTFNYGQRAVQPELKATQAIAAHYQLPHKIIDLPWIADLLPQALSAANAEPLVALTEAELFDVNRVWVPNRNGLFLNIAACLAESMNVNTVVFGANAEEGADFPDNTPEFRDAQTHAFSYSTLTQVKVETPVGELTKIDIIRRGVELDVPFHLIWSCYESFEQQCGACPSCLRVKTARDSVKNSQPVALAFQGD